MSLGQWPSSLCACTIATRHCTSSPHTGPTFMAAMNLPRVAGLCWGVNTVLTTNSVTSAMTTARTTGLDSRGFSPPSMNPAP